MNETLPADACFLFSTPLTTPVGTDKQLIHFCDSLFIYGIFRLFSDGFLAQNQTENSYFIFVSWGGVLIRPHDHNVWNIEHGGSSRQQMIEYSLGGLVDVATSRMCGIAQMVPLRDNKLLPMLDGLLAMPTIFAQWVLCCARTNLNGHGHAWSDVTWGPSWLSLRSHRFKDAWKHKWGFFVAAGCYQWWIASTLHTFGAKNNILFKVFS